jgi:hypothetical protein
MSVPELDTKTPDVESEGESIGTQSGGIADLHGDRVIGITDPRAPVTIMEQVDFYIQASLGNVDGGTATAPRLLPADILAAREETFVSPPGYGDVVRRLRNPGTVVISGAPGCGRSTAALVALRYSGDGSTRFRELPDGGTEYLLDEQAIEEGERLLLDMTAEAGPLSARFVADLRAYRAIVTERQAYLAVVLPPQLRHVADELGTGVTNIGRPDGPEVFRRHLSVLGVPTPDGEHAGEALTRRLARDPMGEIAALAQRIRQARDTAGGGRWPDWLDAAMHPDAELDTVARFVRENRDGRVRALVLAAAMFENAAPDAVAAAATTLLDVLNYPAPEAHRLDLPDLAEALAEVKASIQERSVQFGTITYGQAVRTHFWRTFPDLRFKLRRWIDVSARSRDLPATERVEVLLRYTDQCLRTDHPEDLCDLVNEWSRRPDTSVDQLLATGPALTRGLLDERHGARFRRRVYDWSHDRRLPPSLATLLIGLCDKVIAPYQPGQALVRLRHLAHHPDENVVREARTTLAKLAVAGEFARRMLTRVHSDLVGERPRTIDFDLFTDVAVPARLTGSAPSSYPRLTEPDVAAQVAECWASWMDNQPHHRFAEAVRPWLAGAVGRTSLLDVLAEATHDRPRRRAALYAAARDWVAQAPTPAERRVRQGVAVLLQRSSRPSSHPTEPRTEDGVTDPC